MNKPKKMVSKVKSGGTKKMKTGGDKKTGGDNRKMFSRDELKKVANDPRNKNTAQARMINAALNDPKLAKSDSLSLTQNGVTGPILGNKSGVKKKTTYPVKTPYSFKKGGSKKKC